MTTYLIDASSVIYKYFYGLPPMARSSDDHPVNAIHGCCSVFWRLAKKCPSHAAIIYDSPKGSVARLALDQQYKGNRPSKPSELKIQFPIVRHAADAFSIKRIEVDGVEADDVIAALTRQSVNAGHKVVIASVDKDLAQLVSDDVTMFDPMKNKVTKSEDVIAKFGVRPDQMGDYLALVGDESDNIKGVPGVGKKTAADLLGKFGDMESIFDNLDLISKPALHEKLRDNIHTAKLARQLVALDDRVDCKLSLDDISYPGFEIDKINAFLIEWELVSMQDKIDEHASDRWITASSQIARARSG